MNDVTIIDRFLDTFSRYIDSGFGLLQGEVAFLTATLIVIDMTIAGLYWAMSHATGQGDDVIAKLLRKVLCVGAFAYIIGNFNWLASIVFRSFRLGNYRYRLGHHDGELPSAGPAGEDRHRRSRADSGTDRGHGWVPRGVREHRPLSWFCSSPGWW
ncbi:type IV secretion system protein [Enterobacter cloacae complex sp. 288G10]|uniref:type IV secretion system protein n=1 Tax=Enterobacter cloacae complex sp. 288G10 TaxID=3395859 RepID=UPI003CF44C38